MRNWKRMAAAVGVAFAVMVLLFVIIVALQPGEFRVTRSATMNAPPAKVFEQVNDFHRWEGWSPWAKLDPNAKAVFAGPEAGEGAKFSWSGNEKVGAGTQTIVDSKPDERIRIRLDFEKPMKDTSEAEFTFQPKEGQTVVTWSMYGKKNFVGKAVCMFMNMDQMIGGDFEKGLASLKAIVEKPAEAQAAAGSDEKPSNES